MTADGTGIRVLRLLAVLSIVIPAAFLGITAWRSHDRHMAEADGRLHRTLDLLHEHAARVLETHELVAAQVNAILDGLPDEAIREREPSLHPRLGALVAALPQLQDVWVVDRDGRPLVTGNVFPVPRTLNLSDRAYFRVHADAALSPDATYVSEALRGRAQDVTFFQLSRRRSRDGRPVAPPDFAGVTAVSVEPAYFERFFEGALRGGGLATASLIREDGAVLARHPPLPNRGIGVRLNPETEFMRSVAARREGTTFEVRSSLDGARRLIAFRRLPQHNLIVAAGFDIVAVRAAWRTEMTPPLVLGILSSLALLFLSIVALRRAAREHAALTRLQEEAARREAAEEQLRQAQKMEAVGRLTGGIAHDFNNLLTIVIGNLERARAKLDGADDRVRRSIENALAGAGRAATLTARLLAFSRRQALKPEAVDANRLVAGMSDLLRRTLGEAVTVGTNLAPGLPPVLADRNQLESAILNLCVNARDAMPGGGRLTIATAADPGTGEVVIAVSDTGTGMAPEVAAQAFEPFFTTKDVGKGTGLGLSQVYGFARQSGGGASIESAPGHGTTVRVRLPRAPEGKANAEADDLTPPPSVARRAAGGGETILVVEDEDMVRHLAVEVLEEAGYRVLDAADGEGALRALDAAPGVALLFTDVILGAGMSGRDVAEEARRRRPGLRVLYASGHDRDVIARGGRLNGDVDLLRKPFAAGELLDRVAAALRRDVPVAG